MSAPTSSAVELSWLERRGVVALVGFAFAAIFLLATHGDPVRMNWGDPMSDGNAMTSGRYFADEGFLRTAMTPVLDADSLRYTHYPPLPDLVNGAQRALFGFDSIAQFRWLAAACSLAGLFLFWRFTRRITGPGVADYAVVLVATNLIWLEYADTVHHVPLYMAAGYLALDRAAAWLAEHRRHQLVTTAVAATLCALASYDFVFYLPIMTAMTIWLTGGRVRDRASWPILAAVAGGLVLAAVIKLTLIAWAVGPAQMARDVFFQFEERSTHRYSSSYIIGIVPVVLGRAIRFFTPLYVVLFGVAIWTLQRWRRDGRAPLPLAPLAFLAGGLPFCIVFTQLVVEQYHPVLQMLPFHAVGFATVIVLLRRHARPVVRAAGLALLAVLVGWQLREIARFPRALVEERDLREVGAHLARVDQRRFVLSNLLVDGPVRYYWNRHLIVVPYGSGDELDARLRDLFATYGAAPIRFVEYADAPRAAFDKLLLGHRATRRRWEWIGFPWVNRRRWLPLIVAANQELMEAVRRRGELELDNGMFRVYRIDPFAGDRAWAITPGSDATTVDLGAPDAVRAKLHGFAAAAPGPDGVAASAIVGHREYDVRFTMHGLVDVDTGRTTMRAAVQLHVLPDERAAIRIRIAGPPGARVGLALDGVDLGRAALTGGWQDVTTLALPAAALDRARRLDVAGGAPDILVFTVDGAAAGAVHVATVAALVDP